MRLLMGFVCLWGTLFAGLQERIEGVIAERDPTALVGIEVYAVRKGKVIYAQNSERRFLPGSCLKVISGLAALGRGALGQAIKAALEQRRQELVEQSLWPQQLEGLRQ